MKHLRRFLCWVAAPLLGLYLLLLLIQCVLIHKGDYGLWQPDYATVPITEDTDAETIFCQTGLSPVAAARVLQEEGPEGLERYQAEFFADREVECSHIFGYTICSDRMAEDSAPAMADLRPGDIIVNLCAHCFGWRNGHTGLIIGENESLESPFLGIDALVRPADHWRSYSHYVVLRPRDLSEAQLAELLDFSRTYLIGARYKLTSGFFGPKAPEPDSPQFGVHCSYLGWYAYQHIGLDLDSSGGRLVTTRDILESPLLEVVQVYGVDPGLFLDRMAE